MLKKRSLAAVLFCYYFSIQAMEDKIQFTIPVEDLLQNSKLLEIATSLFGRYVNKEHEALVLEALLKKELEDKKTHVEIIYINDKLQKANL